MERATPVRPAPTPSGQFCSVADDTLIPAPDIRLSANVRVAVVDPPGRWGYVMGDGQCFFPIQYEHAMEILVEYAGVRVSQRKAFVDGNGRLFPLLATKEREADSDDYLVIDRSDTGWVLRTSAGKLVSQFHDVQSYFHEGRALFETCRGWEYLDVTGQPVFAPPSGQAGHYKNGRARFLAQGKWGFVDRAGHIVVNPRFGSAWNFSEGLAAVELDGRWGYVNEAAEFVVDARFCDARDFSCGLARVSPDVTFVLEQANPGGGLERRGSYGFIDPSGQFIVPPQYRAAVDFSEGLAAVRSATEWGFIDSSGELRIPLEYSWVSSFHGGRACASRERRYGYLNPAGAVAVEFKYTKAFDYSEGLAAVRENERWGFIDPAGSWVIAPTFEDVSPFRGGLARTAHSGKFGYISATGDWVISARYDDATSYSEGLALVREGAVRSCIDPNGNTVFVLP